MFRSEKLLKSVRHFACQHCGKHGHTVPAHANWQQYGKGTGLKAHDCFVAALCTACHDYVDGRIGKATDEERQEIWANAWRKTILLWFESGVLHVK